ncbi:hypothetical protein [Ktedonospora formicarum]|uniref:Uncharacterized protein n=1 Tax=Ktedonospora formicarum TaxID=2778364 RepID=A0A8J3MTN1_9CHLR|nr:hypothetical protein [Ktedonospora formicarum]GHO44555.1 hypothetical protein KSX_27180 [Ktedonospora formicarum]
MKSYYPGAYIIGTLISIAFYVYLSYHVSQPGLLMVGVLFTFVNNLIIWVLNGGDRTSRSYHEAGYRITSTVIGLVVLVGVLYWIKSLLG